MPGTYLKPAYTLLSDSHLQPALSHDRQVAVRAANAFNLNSLRSHSWQSGTRSHGLAEVHVCMWFNHREYLI